MLVHPNFDPVLFAIGPVKIHWYGVMYVLGFVGAYLLASKRKARLGWSDETVSDLFFYAALGVIIGGRLGYCFLYKPAEYLANPISIVTGIQDGGMSFHGGFLGVVLAVIYFAKKENTVLPELADFVAVLAPIGLFFGRMGNFINQELWGRASDLPWAMVFPASGDAIARHPSMLYEAILEGVLLFAFLYVFSLKQRQHWQATGLFLLGYGLSRFIVEFVRIPDQHIGYLAWGWLTIGQIYTIPMIIIGIYLFIRKAER